MSRLNNEEFWREFINLYRSVPAVWRIKSEVYKNRSLKEDAYLILTEKLKEIDPTANVNTTKKKINILRSNYRRELKKVLASEKSGTEDIYVPSVWYFNELKFLRDHVIQNRGTSTMDEENEEILEYTEEIFGLEKACKHPQKDTSHNDMLAKVWAMELNKLEPDQQLFTQKAINDILFEARLKTLHRNSVKINHTCACSRTPAPIYSPETALYLSGDSNSS